MPWDEVGGEEEKVHGLDVFRVHRDDLFFDAWDRMFNPRMGDLIAKKLMDYQADVVHVHHWIRLTHNLLEHIRQFSDLKSPIFLSLHDLATSCPRGFRMNVAGEPCFVELSESNCLHCAPRWPWMFDEETKEALQTFAATSRRELELSAGAICASEAVKSLLTSGLNSPHLVDRIHVLPFGHDPVFASPIPPLEEPEVVFRFAYWGSITERKGVKLLVAAFNEFMSQRQGDAMAVELHLFGKCDLPEREKNLKEAAQGQDVIFHGRYEYEDIKVAKIHAAVFPSLCIETYGLVLDEAFELGLPVIVANQGAFMERAGSAGKLFEAGNVGSLACALGALVDDPNLYAQLVAAVPEELPRFDQFVQQVMEVYQTPQETPPVEAPDMESANALRRQSLRMEAMFRKLMEKGEGQGYGPQ